MQVRGAHSAFLVEGVIHTSDQASCPRVALLRSRDVQQKHDEATLARFEIGHQNEVYFCDTFLQHTDYQSDKEVVRGFFTGHADLVVRDTVYELKSVTSKNVYKKVFDKGQYKLSNLAQLIGYMWASGNRSGILAYTFWEEKAEEDVDNKYSKSHKPGITRQFSVSLLDDGAIVVDGLVIDYTLAQWYNHHKLLVESINRPMVHVDFPFNPQDEWTNPCKWCPFHKVCESFNPRTESVESFVEQCKELVK